jgi:phosphoenolpyruvate synthase/pyruvate phosphate dikinase
MSGERVFWLDDLTQGDAARVGRKCANLGELTRANFHVPPGFALCLDAYEDFLHDTGVGGVIAEYLSGFDADADDPKQLARFAEASAVARAHVEAQEMPGDLAALLAGYYEKLGARAGMADVPVATRSAGPASHPGQYESYLNVRGRDAVIEGVKKVWSSTFNTRSLIARARKGLPLGFDPIGVAVLMMVDADVAGVMFTAEPTTANATTMIIEGSRGLGEIVVSGAVIPDNWTVDASRWTIIDRRMAPRAGAAADGGAVPADAGCLADDEVLAVARVGKLVEKHFGKPQDIEWAIDRDSPGDPVFILQTRPETFRIDFRF